MERKRRVLKSMGVEYIYGRDSERLRFWLALWTSVSEAFKDYSLACLLRDWRPAAV